MVKGVSDVRRVGSNAAGGGSTSVRSEGWSLACLSAAAAVDEVACMQHTLGRHRQRTMVEMV